MYKRTTRKMTQIYTISPVCRKEEDTAEHLLDCEVELEKGKHTIGSSNTKIKRKAQKQK